MYSVLKSPDVRKKLHRQLPNFPGASTEFREISSISGSNFKLQEISGSCRHPKREHADRSSRAGSA